MQIKDIAIIITDRADWKRCDKSNYISTENMLTNFGGIVFASSLPTTAVTSFMADDTLISNIRPYFKKVWFAKFDGGCSNDVICLRTKIAECLPRFLFYLLNSDKFIDTFVASSKGTKMPRGDKKALLEYEFDLPSPVQQRHIVNTKC